LGPQELLGKNGERGKLGQERLEVGWALAIDELILNDTERPTITTQVRIIEHWWYGIGKWKT
jgi:hypothetical protein